MQITDEMVEMALVSYFDDPFWQSCQSSEDADEARDGMRAALEAALSITSGEPAEVQVRALEWDKRGPSIQVAKTIFGEYRVTEHMGIDFHAHFNDRPVGDGPWRRDVPAKAAAQADFEARIRGCLSPVAIKTEHPVAELVERAFDIGRMWNHALSGHVLDARDVQRTLGSDLFAGLDLEPWPINQNSTRDEAICAAVAAIKAALRRASPSPVAAPGWQPISSAPKDGSRVLLGRFTGDKKASHEGYCSVDWWRRPEDDAGFTGWGHFNPQHWPPTHWMPLPSPHPDDIA